MPANVESLSEILSEIFGFPRLAFSGIEELLKFLFEKSVNEKIVLVLDEYPYIRESVKGLDSILQSLIDNYKDISCFKLIICGSHVDTMRELIDKQNPLYGKVDMTMELKQMDYYESALFYNSFSDEDKVRLYSVFGGVPYYNRLIDAAKTVRENIINLIASNGARLENEVSMYLNSEISKMTNANEVFETLAKGFSKYKDILDQSHVSSGPTLVDVLEKLIRMDIVKREAPINHENNRKKAGYYISEDFETKYVPRIFEEIGRQYLIRMNLAGRMEEPFYKIGKYYYDDPAQKKNGEFDIVTQDDKGYIFYEAKFRKEPVTADMIAAEIRQVREAKFPCYKYGFISRAGFSAEEIPETKLIDLKELYEKTKERIK